WVADWLGVGGAAEIGYMADRVGASNGHVTFDRIPLVGTVHLMLRLSHQWYCLVGGGVRKDLAAEVYGGGAGSGVGAPFTSLLGGVAQAGMYYALNEHVGFDGLFRLTVMDYSAPGGTVNASNGGLLMGWHLNF